jgi:hypothetical protein
MQPRSFITYLLAHALISCGGGAELDYKTAHQTYQVASLASSQAMVRIFEELGDLKPGSSGWLSGTSQSYTINGSLQNTSGSGSATITGNGGVENNLQQMTMNVDYADWRDPSTGLVLNGRLEQMLTIDLKTIQFKLTMKGDLDVSGSANGIAAIDMKMTLKDKNVVSICGQISGQSFDQNCQ